MKISRNLGFVATACGVALLAGCASEKIVADYVMPARSISDVSTIEILAIESEANITGNNNAGGIAAETASMVKLLASARLYQEGRIKTSDNIWGGVDGMTNVNDYMIAKGANHGYPSLASEQNVAKATLKLSVNAGIDSTTVAQSRKFNLTTIPYVRKVNEKGVPSSRPGAIAVVPVEQPYTVTKTVVEGTLKASIVNSKGVELYAGEYPISLPAGTELDSAAPSPIKALSLAVGPALDQVIADVSPHKVSRELKAAKGGNQKIVLLLEAKAFSSVLELVEELGKNSELKAADYENEGIANEALGDIDSAKSSYEQALKLDSGAKIASQGIARIDEMKKTIESAQSKE